MAGCNTTRMRPHDRASEQTVLLAQKSPARDPDRRLRSQQSKSSATTPSAGCVGATDPIEFLGWRRVCPRRYLHRGGSGPIEGGGGTIPRGSLHGWSPIAPLAASHERVAHRRPTLPRSI
jgi:hypothetical protein